MNDILYQLLLHTSMDDLCSMFMVNKQTLNISRIKHFWVEKLKYEHVKLTLPLLSINTMINRIKLKMRWDIAKSIMDYFNQLPGARTAYRYQIYIHFDTNVDKLIRLIRKLFIVSVDYRLFKDAALDFSIDVKGDWYVYFYGHFKDRRKKTYFVKKENLTDTEVIHYLAATIGHFPTVDITTNFHRTTSYFDLIKK